METELRSQHIREQARRVIERSTPLAEAHRKGWQEGPRGGKSGAAHGRPFNPDRADLDCFRPPIFLSAAALASPSGIRRGERMSVLQQLTLPALIAT